MEGFCVINIYFSPLWCVGKGVKTRLICFRGILERHCHLEASWCCKSIVQFPKWGFLYLWGLQVLCRHNKLFCAWALLPAHFLAESWFSKCYNNDWEVDLALCLCLLSGWWGGSLLPPLSVPLPLVPNSMVCLLPFVKESFPWVAWVLIFFMQNTICYSGMKFREAVGSLSFSLPFTVNYYWVLFCFSSGYVKKIPESEHRSQIFSWALPSAMQPRLESQTAYGSLTCRLKVMVTSKHLKRSSEGGFKVGEGRKCQCQCLVLQVPWYWLPHTRVHEDFIRYFLTGVWNTVRWPSTKSLSLQSLHKRSAGQQARVCLCPFVLWCIFSLHTEVETCAYLLCSNRRFLYTCIWAAAEPQLCIWVKNDFKMLLCFFGYIFKHEICKSEHVCT